jgi:hypothetical protein
MGQAMMVKREGSSSVCMSVIVVDVAVVINLRQHVYSALPKLLIYHEFNTHQSFYPLMKVERLAM